MKQPKKLTRNHKVLLSKIGINPKGLMLMSETKERMTLIESATGTVITVDLEAVSNGGR